MGLALVTACTIAPRRGDNVLFLCSGPYQCEFQDSVCPGGIRVLVSLVVTDEDINPNIL